MPGRIIRDIAPGKNNPRNSEGAFIRQKNGAIMFVYSRFQGETAGDDVMADIAAMYSYDDGETFGDGKILFRKEEHNARNIMSTSAQWLDDDTMAVFYCIRRGFHDTRSFMRISEDDGKTFDAGRYCINYPGYFVTNNDRAVVLSNGRLFVPAAYHRCIGPDPQAWESWDSAAVSRFFYSDDKGQSFYEAKGFGALNVPTGTGLQEPGVVELEPGHLFCYCRTDLGCQYVSHSYDFGNTWEPFVPSGFSSPASPMAIKKIPGKDTYIAIYNPVPNSPETYSKAGWGRNPLVAAVSNDGCKTFSVPIVIEDDKESGFCYPTMFFTKDSFLLSYCAGGPDDGACLNRIRIRKINLSEIIDL